MQPLRSQSRQGSDQGVEVDQGAAPQHQHGAASASRASLLVICLCFWVSGFPALIYQLTWQRALFTIYGINIESVTIVVTGFMAGLGLGSLLGGWLSHRKRLSLLLCWSGIELCIGLFGCVSLKVFHLVGQYTLHAPAVVVKLAPLLLLLLPTLGMGATLPLLVMYLIRRSGNVGRSVGLLYFLNTLGSAVACFLTAFWLMRKLGMQNTVWFAALLNFIAGVAGIVVYVRYRDGIDARQRTLGPAAFPISAWLSFPSALVFAAISGFISLSHELLWYRVFFYLGGGSALAFAILLGAFLGGIAIGAAFAQRLCTRMEPASLLRLLSTLVYAASLLGFLLIPIVARCASINVHTSDWHILHPLEKALLLLMLGLVTLTASLMGAAFPLISHLGVVADTHTGARLSYLYVANIAGSIAGSLCTGFVLMDLLSLPQLAELLAILGLGFAAFLSLASGRHRRLLALRLGATAVLMAVVLALAPRLFDHVYERLFFQFNYANRAPFADTVENRSGIIHVAADGMVLGGAMYDGWTQFDFLHEDALIRPFSLSLLHPAPREVLSIGLAGGVWAQILANEPHLTRLTIIEINPGYLEIVARYPQVRSLLQNPKVQIIIDDGRRWLSRHPERTFDVIFQNTTWHFRAHASNLLSQEYLTEVAGHLKPGGLSMFNTTFSARAQRTACLINPNALREINMMVIPKNGTVEPAPERWRAALTAYRIDGRPVFDLSQPASAKRLSELVKRAAEPIPALQSAYREIFFERCDSILARTQELQAITDDNMGAEWSFWRALQIFP